MAQAIEAPALRADSLRGSAGFFRAGQDPAGRWWLVEPSGSPFFASGAHDLPSPPAIDLLRSWGCNMAGLLDVAPPVGDLPFLGTVDFCRVSQMLVAPGLRLPDVFDPDWRGRAATLAQETCTALADHPGLVGWITDRPLAWAQKPADGRPSLLQLCLSLEPSHAAYHAAWEFALAPHRGQLDSLARAWGAAIPNREAVRELTRAETGFAGRGYLRDNARWSREFARRYFTGTSAAIHAADHNHLVLGCRLSTPAGADVLAECAYPAVDVSLPDWRDLPDASSSTSQPLLASEVCWALPEFWHPGTGHSASRLTPLEHMLRRARTRLEKTARHPAVVGCLWAQWRDDPGERPPFARGLLHLDGTIAREHTDLLAQFNARASLLHQQTLPPRQP